MSGPAERMNGLSEEMLIAYADGELDELNRRRVEQAVAADPALAARLAQHVALRERLSGHYALIADAPVPDRFAALLKAEDKIVDLAAARERRRPVARSWMISGALAASLVIGLLLGRGIGGESGPVGIANGQMVAQGALAQTLDSQLASAQAAGTPYRIGISFRAKDGAWCRSFDGAALAGVACRGDGAWRLEQAVGGRAQATDYRQAASGDPRVMATVEGLIAGDAADAATERQARDAGWK
ncbi:anti-sigma factor [Sphingobium sp. H39-3-25]|uniref:anti-sigma factor n=1 Tax=Sphingobium arseniciresistens TaxID=3030834 RepID=UPI0023B8E6AF|nr:anti-sigma factor [Sphingobium arseniciresistens]